MVDGWMGDDWFHYGAFRQPNIDYIAGQTAKRGEGERVPREAHDDYTNFLEPGRPATSRKARGHGATAVLAQNRGASAYDGFWQAQALDKLIAKKPLTVPTMWEQGLWDQEDMWGAIHCYRALEPKDTTNDMNYLVMGPWFHSQINAKAGARPLSGRRHARAVAQGCAAAVLQSVSEGRVAEGRHAAGADLQHRRDSWDRLAAVSWRAARRDAR